jgi:hypothetical protein
MIEISQTVIIPDSDIEISAIRSQGAGGQNVSTAIGGTAGVLTIHRLAVLESYRYLVVNVMGVCAVMDIGGSDGLQPDAFLAYASFASYNTSGFTNYAGFGTQWYPGNPAGSYGCAPGPSIGPGFLSSRQQQFGAGSEITTTSQVHPIWWCPWDVAGNPAGTSFPGTSSTTAAPGLFAGSSYSTAVPGWGGGAWDSSTAFATRGGSSAAIIYQN